MNNRLFFLLKSFLRKNHLELDWEESRIQLLSHPYYPSLNSITDLFSHFDINNYALRVNNPLEVYSQFPDSFLAEIEDGSTRQLVLVSKKIDEVELMYDKERIENISVNNFFNSWTGILVVVENGERSESYGGFNSKMGKIPFIVYFSTLFMLVSLFIITGPSFFELLYFSLTCIGLYVSYLIVKQELGLHSKILNKICSDENKNTSCDKVLHSRGSTIFQFLKLSDVGLVYFITQALSMIILARIDVQLTAIVLVNTLAIPFTFYSLIYQWKIAKSWCPLCLAIVGILWLQFATLSFNNSVWELIHLINLSYVVFIVCFAVITSLWMVIKPLLEKERLFRNLEVKHLKFKRNFKLFSAALNLNSKIDAEIPYVNELVFGNKGSDALLKLIFITNPMCGFCKESHQLFQKILKLNNPDIQIKIRFNVQATDDNNIGSKIAARTLELYHIENEERCLNALSDIFSEIDGKSWLRKWGGYIDRKYFTTLEYEKEWCNGNFINFTPHLLVNGQGYPDEYEKMDLLFFIDDLIECQEKVERTRLSLK
ncbi:vitamin K epoxide reductase family protein [Salegentibacter sp. UBA1130]|uniref:vitamin K epoxide reductase family protein n=1 Tax=Salegentibacter sp. UBA1130 TaxID=1947451 RepID=UPI00257A83A3|nr:vitamin K epoxide reductase family protein [Salegentibacter sp. UBA1130]